MQLAGVERELHDLRGAGVGGPHPSDPDVLALGRPRPIGRIHLVPRILFEQQRRIHHEPDVRVGADRLALRDHRREPGLRRDVAAGRVPQMLRADPDHDLAPDVLGEPRSLPDRLVVDHDPMTTEDQREATILAAVQRRLREIHRRRAHEAGNEQVVGSVVDPRRRVHLLQRPLAHHADAVAERQRLGLVVRDVQHRRSELALDPGDLVPQLDPEAVVEAGQRLVHQERARLADDRAPERDPLRLATGERPRCLLEERAQAERRRGAAHASVDLGLLQLPRAQAEGQVVVHRHVRVQRQVLEHHRDVPLRRRAIGHVLVVEEDPALRHAFQTGDQAQQRRLARSGRSEQDEQLSVVDPEVNGVHRDRAVAEDLRHAVERDRRHRGAPRSTMDGW